MNQKGFTPILVLVVILIIGGTIGTVYYFHSPSRTKLPSTNNSIVTLQPTPSIIDSSSPSPVVSVGLQSYFVRACKNVPSPGAGNETNVDMSLLPISLDPDIKDNIAPKSIICWSQSNYYNDAYLQFSVKLNGTSYIYTLYDSLSKELGHGGYPSTSVIGTSIYKHGDINITEFITGSDVGAIIGQTAVDLEGTRTFTLKDGSKFYVKTVVVAVPSNDPRLLKIFNKYAEVSKANSNFMDVDSGGEAMDKDIINTFFSNPPNLADPEKQNFETLITLLNDIRINSGAL